MRKSKRPAEVHNVTPNAAAAKRPDAAKGKAKRPASAANEAAASKPTTKATKTATTPKAAPRAKLPAALAERAEAQHALKTARLAKEARDDIALILRMSARIDEDFYSIGEALVRLKRPGVAQAVGRSSFRELCEVDLKMSLSSAERLIAVVQEVSRQDAIRMGQGRAFALVDLARATPEADSATTLEKASRRLPSGKRLDVAAASDSDLRDAAKELRAAKKKSVDARGRTTTPKEREAAAALQAELRKGGLERALVTAVATKPGQGADLRIERVPLAELPALRKALRRR